MTVRETISIVYVLREEGHSEEYIRGELSLVYKLKSSPLLDDIIKGVYGVDYQIAERDLDRDIDTGQLVERPVNDEKYEISGHERSGENEGTEGDEKTNDDMVFTLLRFVLVAICVFMLHRCLFKKDEPIQIPIEPVTVSPTNSNSMSEEEIKNIIERQRPQEVSPNIPTVEVTP